MVNQNLWKRASPSQEKSYNRKSKEQLLRKNFVIEETKEYEKFSQQGKGIFTVKRTILVT